MSNPPGETSPAPRPLSDFSDAEQRATISKISWRLLPLLLFCYIIAYIDRINVGFAKEQFQLQDVLGVDPAKFNSIFGFGMGLFFWGYFLFEVPSNLILHRIGARIWIARIMIVWGLVSLAFMFMKGVTMFYVLRILLGIAEAGFFPGVILYLTYWYPVRERARIVAFFALGGVAAGAIGSPISGAILKMNGLAGLWGWQWLFLLESIPAIVLGFVVLLILPNSFRDARWLTEREKAWVQRRMEQDATSQDASQSHTLKDVFITPQIWLLCLLYFLMNVGGYGFEMWLPSILKELSGQDSHIVGWLNAIPYAIAGVVMLFVGRFSDRTGERRKVVAAAAISAAIGFALAAYLKNPVLALAALTLAFAGIKSTIAPFWAMSTAFLSGTAAAGGIAFINSVGNLGGWAGPHLVGIFKDSTGNDVAAMLLLGGALLGMGILVLLLPKSKPKPA